MNGLNFHKFYNPNLGELSFARVVGEILSFMAADQQSSYKLMIGSDSNGTKVLDLVSVIAVHRIGSGGRYFWCRAGRDGIHTLRQKIYAEVESSLELAARFLVALRNSMSESVELPFDFEIHVDVGRQGETRDLIHEVTGMVRGMGYAVFIKPQSVAATSVADRHVR